MLLPCPECGKQISDRASACPGCGFPIAQHLTSERDAKATELDRSTREEVGEADCPHCEARGFLTVSSVDDHAPRGLVEERGETKGSFAWCSRCEHSGRLALVRSGRGYWAVAYAQVKAFVSGELDAHEGIVFLGTEPPAGHRYEQAGKRIETD